MQPTAIQLILQDHQCLGTVLRTLREAVDQAGKPGATPDFDALRAMLFYLDEMPTRIHHASENTLLFPRLRECCAPLRPVLDRLEAEHERGEAAARELEQALTAWELMGETRYEAFQMLLHSYATGYLGHMEVEENYILPVALDYLSPADWQELEDTLLAQRSDSESILRSHRALFDRITSPRSIEK